MPSISRGIFVWYDLMTSAPDAAIEFYRKVIGWDTQTWKGPQPYTMWKHDEKTVGGVMQLPDEAAKAGAPPHWLSYVSTPDVDATVADAQRLGARVYVPPTDIPEVGRFAVLADPQGASFACFQPLDERYNNWDPQVGDVSWNELVTSDAQAGFAFYQSIFGWEMLQQMDMGGGLMYYLFGQNDKQYGGMYAFMPGMPPFPYWTPYVHVTGLDDRVERVRQHGGQVMNGPMEVPGGGRIAQCMDPQGAVFAVHETK